MISDKDLFGYLSGSCVYRCHILACDIDTLSDLINRVNDCIWPLSMGQWSLKNCKGHVDDRV